MKHCYFLLLFLLTATVLWAQPEPCTGDPPEMTPTCGQACIICDIDGFSGRHESAIPGSAPPDFCTFIVHNAQWIAFIAGSENLTIEIQTSNCQQNLGLEVGIYEGIDCDNFRSVSTCLGGTNTPITPGTPRQISTTVPLVIGQYYFLVMDGAFGDNCDWTLNVVAGSTQVDPLTEAPQIEGPTSTCPEATTTYFTPGLEGGTSYSWTLDGVELSQADSVEIDWPGSGVYELCLNISNACDEAPPTCQNIVVNPIPVTVFEEIVCEGECFALNDTIELCEEGFFEFNFTTADGCDSIVFVDLVVFEDGETQLSAVICEGDSLFVGGLPFFTTDIHTTVLDNYLGCDSTIVLDLTTVVCEIMGTVEEVPVVCNGASNGQILFSVVDGTPPFTYTWRELGNSMMGSGNIAMLNTSTSIAGLPIGTYLITINDNFGNDLVLIQEVTEPELLEAELILSDYNGFPVSCAEGTDGTLEAFPCGGVSPYSFSWSNGGTTAAINQLSAGTYDVQITDAAGCVQVFSEVLTAPAALQADVLFSNPDCGGGDTGFIQALSTGGGVPPYNYQLDGGGLEEENLFANLSTGEYTFTVVDANGCESDSSAFLQGRVIPVVELGADTAIDLGETFFLFLTSNVALDSVVWSPEESLSCSTCPRPEAQPLMDTYYQVAVTSADGCTTVDSMLISVRDVRDVYVPNAFSPNRDGVNDQLVIYGGPEVAIIRKFRVFNRWGDLIFEQSSLLPNSSTGAWDGRFQGDILGSDVFVWLAEIEFIDGRVIPYSGDVLLLN
ncbi:MAG: gliding motility-associated C-terminal domain-containing protein [Bacteroidota bacterium]